MIDRINLILKAKNLTSRQFAEEIGIQPSGMSHILSGRNRPSLDFVMKVVNRYPEIDLKWLTLGEGEMYNTSAPIQKKEKKAELDLFSAMEDDDDEDELPVAAVSSSQVDESKIPLNNDSEFPTETLPQESIPVVGKQNITPLSTDNITEETDKNKNRQEETRQEVHHRVENRQEESRPEENRSVDAKKEDNGVEPIVPTSRRKKIVKFVVLYDDHTFAEYFPE